MIFSCVELRKIESLLKRAKKRLAFSAQSGEKVFQLAQLIAEQVGYRNQANFNRQFKAYKQLTPRAYRNEFKLASKA